MGFITYVIRMPEAAGAKKAITEGVRALVQQHGAEITGISANDEMTLAEMYEKRLSEWDATDARKEADALWAES
jgi:hypothetical protein